jgi:ABC-type transport system involved in Fe-S cluster assembly fused permease/ATPase subunit
MANRYFFDKRDIKHFLIKYGVMLLISIPILLGINILFTLVFNVENMVFLDIVFLCVIVVLYEYLYSLIKAKREQKKNPKEK